MILLGILRALAADAWWGHRTERIEEREYLIALEDELATLKTYAEDVIRHVSDIEDSGSTLLRISANGKRRGFPPIRWPIWWLIWAKRSHGLLRSASIRIYLTLAR